MTTIAAYASRYGGNTQSEQSPKNKDTSGIRWVRGCSLNIHFNGRVVVTKTT